MLNSLSQIATKTATVIVDQNWVLHGIVIVFAMLAPLENYVHFLIFLLIVDAITSIYYQAKVNLKKVKRIKGKELTKQSSLSVVFLTIESSRLRRTFEKLVAYIVGIIVCFLFDIIVLQITPLETGSLSYFSISNTAVLLICSVELTSILANLSKITQNPVYDTILRIFNKKVNDKINSYGNDNNS